MLDAQQRQQIGTLLSIGAALEVAAAFVGCTEQEIRRAAKSDEKLAAELRGAESRAELALVQNLFAAAKNPKDWRASAWVLERRFPQRYALRKGAAMTAVQISAVLSEFARIVADEVPDRQHRQRVLDRLVELTDRLAQRDSAEPHSGESVADGE